MDTSDGLRGLHVTSEGMIYQRYERPGGSGETHSAPWSPFLWSHDPVPGATDIRELQGTGALRYLSYLPTPAEWRDSLRQLRDFAETVRPLEQQVLMSRRERMFAGLKFQDLRRCQLVIATACEVEGGFSLPTRKGDRVLAIGLWFSDEPEPLFLALEDMSDESERALLKRLGQLFEEKDPDVIEGHNVFNFDLDYLVRRARRFRVNRNWGRFGLELRGRKSRLRVAERWIDYMRYEAPGRTVFDTALAAQIYDVSSRDLPSYGLKDVAQYFGLREEEGSPAPLEEIEPQRLWAEDRARFFDYLKDKLRDIRGIGARLLPTYVAQVQNIPITLQDAFLRGTASKVDALILERYLQAGVSLSEPPEVQVFEGGFSKSFRTGVYSKVEHFDVASLYPSLLLHIGRNPVSDTMGTFLPLLEELRDYRLEYKKRAAETTDPVLKGEYNARQTSFKILINSFYGYLGFAGARFGDSELAAEVTKRGRELLQSLIKRAEECGYCVLEADTDGFYLSAPDDQPVEHILATISEGLPDAIVLEHGGSYRSMFCYKAKNYALYDGENVLIRGSALRSRGIEPFLKELTDTLIGYLLGATDTHPLRMAEEMESQIRAGTMPVDRLLKSENLSMNPETYRKKMESGGKPRRAALEVALSIEPLPRMGDRVSYFLGPKQKGRSADWQRAHPASAYDPASLPYDAAHYVRKLEEWKNRYVEFLEAPV